MSETESGSSPTGKLCEALARARAEAPWYVTKGGYNQHQRYPFVGHPDVMAHPGRTLLAAHGLCLVQTRVEFVSAIEAGKNPALLWRGEYLLLHTSGEKLALSLSATTQANDKSAFVASTSLDRVVHLRVLELAGSDDEDPDHTDRGAQNGAPDPKALQAERVAERRDAPQLSEAVVAMLASLDNAQTRDDAEKVLAEARALRPKVTPYEQSAITHHAHQCMQRHGIERKTEVRA